MIQEQSNKDLTNEQQLRGCFSCSRYVINLCGNSLEFGMNEQRKTINRIMMYLKKQMNSCPGWIY